MNSFAIIPARKSTLPAIILCRLAEISLGCLCLFSCAPLRTSPPDITVRLTADGAARDVRTPSGSSVADILAHAGVTLDALDRVIPPLYSLVADGSAVQVIRVRERFDVETVTVPFEKQTVRNDALPSGATRLVQAGKNGQQEITYRVVAEDGVDISRTAMKTNLLEDAVPEIWMVGVNSSLRATAVSGALCFVDAGNAWFLSATSSQRIPLASSGKLDSRIFRLSPDGMRLLYSAKADSGINALYYVDVKENAAPVNLNAGNVTLFADWSPTEAGLIAYSGVRPITMAPGWQAQNDLRLIVLDPAGKAPKETVLLPANAQGVYSWWGTAFAWSPDGTRIAYARADQIGWVDRSSGNVHVVRDITPFQARSDWVWLPPLQWTPDGNFLLAVMHDAPLGLELPEASPLFDLAAISLNSGSPIILMRRTGMFAYPAPSPKRKEGGYNVAFLQAMRPLESDQSQYQVGVMDRDASNLRMIFPPEGDPGLEAQQVEWSPDGSLIALIYQGNLWLVDVSSGNGQPLTSDGQVTKLDWR